MQKEEYERLKVMLKNANISLTTMRTLVIFQETLDSLYAIFGAQTFQSVLEKDAGDALFYEVVANSQDSSEVQKILKDCGFPCIEVTDGQYVKRDGSQTRPIDESELEQLIEN